MRDMTEIDTLRKLSKIRCELVLSPVHTFQHKSEIFIVYPLVPGAALSELFYTPQPNNNKGIEDE
eukprot:CAMPEP_0202725686 /NCGR_PEP_ID=MMETSP1385-20130828/184134_1 /ASSEMBLY_ACC=CAM_ASM_000861 /TAXON_ID=933848 /ORGANISM="Elphidium margaritaceum" /LENGTH=64 /DNA_ID=CAMNT_0049391877 /DNA_START=1 /DNA_END=192 /DNA_ORIENTATION=+